MRADRLISILMLLQTRGLMTAQALAERLEVSERTIYRDLDALSAAGVPVYTERGPGGGCALLDSYRTNLTGLTEEELRALFLLSIPDPLADLGMSQALEAAQLKLSATISATRRADVEHFRARVHLDSAPWFHPPEQVPHLQTIQEAVWNARRLRITYRRSDGEWINRLLEPYGIVAKASLWYVVGQAMSSLRVYRVTRIEEAQLSDSTFERPADFNLAQFWADWVARFEAGQGRFVATVRVAPAALPNLLRLLGESIQRQIDQAGSPDESGRLTLEISFHSADEAQVYLLGLGDAVEVIAPSDLRQRVIEAAKQTLTAYRVIPLNLD